MLPRSVAGCLCVLTCVATGACMDEREPVRLPTVPGSNTVEPQAPQPPQPVAPIYADPRGEFDITFTASPSCRQQLPLEFRTRTYRATIVGTNGRYYQGQVSGASFYKNYDSFFVATSDRFTKLWISSLYAMSQWGEDQPVFERIGESAYVSVMGMGDISLDTTVTTVSAMWSGSFDFCARAVDSNYTDYPPVCNSVISCKSDSHRVSFTRR